MSQVFTAARQGQQYIPAFQVFKLEGEYEKTIASHDVKKKGSGLDFETVTAQKGWLVVFPVKHGNLPNSIHIETMDELKRMGFDKTTVPLVDDDGEVVGSQKNVITTRKVKADA